VDPGPNYFSDDAKNVWVDRNGCLHLTVRQAGGRWYCSEVIADATFGYGTYVFTLQSRLDLLDQNTVLGLFTWEDCVPEHYYREIDIEFSRWGVSNETTVGQYVIQPWNTTGNRYRFPMDLVKNDVTTHVLKWTQNEVRPDIPPAGGENPRINFWLTDGKAPANGQDAEVVIKSFHYLPLE
jgi:hypothetical protein